jgi:hypothetical protein
MYSRKVKNDKKWQESAKFSRYRSIQSVFEAFHSSQERRGITKIREIWSLFQNRLHSRHSGKVKNDMKWQRSATFSHYFGKRRIRNIPEKSRVTRNNKYLRVFSLFQHRVYLVHSRKVQNVEKWQRSAKFAHYSNTVCIQSILEMARNDKDLRNFRVIPSRQCVFEGFQNSQECPEMTTICETLSLVFQASPRSKRYTSARMHLKRVRRE